MQDGHHRPRAGALAPRIEGPTKPMGGYMWFCKRIRHAVKEAHPEWAVPGVGKEMGRQWKELHDAEKLHYERVAAADRLHYEQVCSEA
jgi:hypothetical protein